VTRHPAAWDEDHGSSSSRSVRLGASHITVPSRPGGPQAPSTWLGADGEQRKMDHPAGGTCDQTPQRAGRRERHAPGRGTSPRQSPSGRNVTPDLGAERIDGAHVEHWRHEALIELRAMSDTAGAPRDPTRCSTPPNCSKANTANSPRHPHRRRPSNPEHDGRPPARQPSRLSVSPGRRAAWTPDFDGAGPSVQPHIDRRGFRRRLGHQCARCRQLTRPGHPRPAPILGTPRTALGARDHSR
jgi:hypothetical protein